MILIGAALSFLGLGVRPPEAELGRWPRSAASSCSSRRISRSCPARAIFLIVLAFNVLGDALRDPLDPSSGNRRLSARGASVKLLDGAGRVAARSGRPWRRRAHHRPRARQRPLRPASLDGARRLRGPVHDRRHAGLARLRHGDDKPGLATSWTVSPDGMTYTFKLRNDVPFCYGKKLTAQGRRLFDYERWIDPATSAWCVARRQGRRCRRHRRLHRRLQAQAAVLGAALPDDPELPHRPEHREGQAARRRLRRQGFNGTGPYCWVTGSRANRGADQAPGAIDGARRSTTRPRPRSRR